MLQGQIYAVIFKNAVVFSQIVVAKADWVMVTSDDGEFHFRVSHQVTALLSVMGDANDFSVPGSLPTFSTTTGIYAGLLLSLAWLPSVCM